jgi:hypothetical protein
LFYTAEKGEVARAEGDGEKNEGVYYRVKSLADGDGM